VDADCLPEGEAARVNVRGAGMRMRGWMVGRMGPKSTFREWSLRGFALDGGRGRW
jgi:hypothetical protein